MLYGILVQHFANVAGSTPLFMATIDVLTVHLLELTAEVPYYAATVARARLTRAHKRSSAALASCDATPGSGGWPGWSSSLWHTHIFLYICRAGFSHIRCLHTVCLPAAAVLVVHQAALLTAQWLKCQQYMEVCPVFVLSNAASAFASF